jgi:putative ABC transport system permease protein
MPLSPTLLPLLKTFSWQELRHHPWRNAAAALAVMLGVALAFSVHLINASALDEFSQAVRSVNGQPDLELRAAQGTFDESVYARVAGHPQVEQASPVLEISTYAVAGDGQRAALRVVGVDALTVGFVAPALMPVPAAGSDRFVLFEPGNVFLNAGAQRIAMRPAAPSTTNPVLRVQSGMQLLDVTVAGTVSASGPALAVMDIGAAQDLFGQQGMLSRIDVKLTPGTDRNAFMAALQGAAGWPAAVTAGSPGDSTARIGNLSRAYRVNLTVLALVALFTGAFLVFSVLSLSVAKRAQQFALLGVLGLTGKERLRLVLLESGALGLVGSLAGIGLGTALAALALRVLGGDLGGGYFAGVAPTLHWSGLAALAYAALGLAAALAGGWWPARLAQRLPPAQTLKGLGAAAIHSRKHWISIILIATGVLLARAPALFDIPLAAYLSVALLLVGGITALPWLIALLLDRVSPWVQQRLLPLLAVERARRVRESASVAVSGVVASLSLAVALTVMVASFRDSITQWLDVVLPADLYVRTASSTAAGDTVFFSPEFVQAVAKTPGVKRVATQRTRQLLMDPARPAVALVARQLDDPANALPLVGDALPVPPGQIGIYVSEAMVDLYGARPGDQFPRLFGALALVSSSQSATFFIAGVWRDYARQAGTVAMRSADFERLTGDQRVNDLALWLAESADSTQVQQTVRGIAEAQSGKPGNLGKSPLADGAATRVNAGQLIEFASSREIRAVSLKIFDRSFAVTYWLQAVAIAIGLFGVAASFSAQVLARRKEFGLMVHLGLTRGQVLGVVAGEGLAWTAIGAIAGLGLGLGVSLVLVHVVNPQSFHWTMDLAVPWPRLLALCAAVVLAGTVTAWLAGRAAAGRDAVLAVKEDW